VGPRSHVIDGSADTPRERGNFLGLSGPFKSRISVNSNLYVQVRKIGLSDV